MKRIVSVSLGASKRNHAFETDFLGEKFQIERVGTDGDWDKAMQLIRDLDGKIDAFGLGGIDLYIYVAGKRYVIKDAKKLAAQARITPIVDGSGLKNTLERKCVLDIQKKGIMELENRKVLMVCGVDRFGMAEAFAQAGADLILGDLIYTVGIPIPVYSLKMFSLIGRIAAPFIVRMPFDKLYPTGGQQEVIIPKYSKYYYNADIIAGDFHYIRRYLPSKMNGQAVITNTTTKEDLQLLKKTGVSKVITTTPDMGGRSFGTNVIEALLVAILNKKIEDIEEKNYYSLLQELHIEPRILDLEKDYD
ncbi:MAG: quinate 5-dehydrogenase [Syntrophomonadaceae bacterium]|nr:quinate 5-dehydrogenase [Syntrophomonadaceae bacterium]